MDRATGGKLAENGRQNSGLMSSVPITAQTPSASRASGNGASSQWPYGKASVPSRLKRDNKCVKGGSKVRA